MSNTPEGLNFQNKQFLLQLAGAQMQSAATVLKYQDPDDAGTDDLIGNVLQGGGEVALRYSANDITGVNDNLVVLRDALSEYLKTQGK